MSATSKREPVRRLPPPWLAIAGKEMRENIKWAALGMIALSLGLLYNVRSTFSDPVTDGMAIACWQKTNIILAGFAPVLAVFFGLAQTVPEQRRDLQAFLVHRPAPRASLFWGKAAVGLVLYGLAIAIPFLGAILWTSAPGNVPGPFVWDLTLAGWASILAGIPFYFAAMLAALRPARWYGSRILPLAAALPVLIPLFPDCPLSFPQAAAIIVACAALFAVATRKAFEAQGEFPGGASAGRASLGIVLFAGSCVSLLIVCWVASLIGESIARSINQNLRYQYYILKHSGETILATNQNGDTTYAAVRTPDGRPENRNITAASAINGIFLTFSFASFGGSEANFAQFTSPEHIVQPAGSELTEPDTVWYYIPKMGRFLGYSLTTRRLTSLIGPRGLAAIGSGSPRSPELVRPGQPLPVSTTVRADQAGRFPAGVMGNAHGIFICGATTLDRIGLGAIAIQRIALPTDAGAITRIDDLNTPLSPEDSPAQSRTPRILVETRTRFVVVSQRDGVLGSIPREFGRARYPLFQPIYLPGSASSALADARNGEGRLALCYESDRDVRIGIWTVSGNKIASWSVPSVEYSGSSPSFSDAMYPAALPVGFWLHHIAAHTPSLEWRDQSGANFGKNPQSFLFGILTLLSALACGATAWRRGLSRRAALAWAVAGLFLGIPGVMTVLALSDWPARVPCSNCRRRRRVSREMCEHCGAPFPAAHRDGTEIFEDAASGVRGEAATPASGREVIV